MKRTIRIVLLLLVMSIVWGSAVYAADNDYEAARKYYYSGKYKKAVEHLQKYIERNPDPSAYYMMGYSLYELKRFNEADDFFRDAYLIDPTYSPIPPAKRDAQEVKPSGTRTKKHAEPAVVSEKPEEKAAVSGTPAQSPKAAPSKDVQAKPAAVEPQKNAAASAQPSKPEAPSAPPAPGQPKTAVTPPQTPAPPVPATPAPPVQMPKFPKPGQGMPPGIEGAGGLAALMGIFAGFALIFLGIGLAIYLFVSYCLYKIATKLNCPAAWTAWIPLLNLWPVVGSAGKPWWWLLLFFVPLVGFFVWVYLWICITENLGKNKWLGLLMIVPLVNIVFMALLAFSKETAPSLPEPEELE